MTIGCVVMTCVAFGSSATASTGTNPARHGAPAGSYQVAQAPYCHSVAWAGLRRDGTQGICTRCVTGPYSATDWTNCSLWKDPGHAPNFAECGAPPNQVTMDLRVMCADAVGGAAIGTGGTIRVTAGTLGANCGVGRGNVTGKVAAICNGKEECTLAGHDVGNPDPAPNCAKDFAVEWQCSGQSGTRSNANPATTNETTLLKLSCKTAAGASGGGISLLGVPYGGGSSGNMTSGTGRATANSGGMTSGTGRATANVGAGASQVIAQQEIRDREGRLTQEAAKIYVVTCQGGANNGRPIYIYQYLRRAGFRAIMPPDWAHSMGGRDFATYSEALSAGCPR